MPEFEMRRATVADRPELIEMLNSVFTGAQTRRHDFGRSHPYLFHDARMRDHTIAIDGGRIIGCVGSYPFTMRIGGVDFRAAGIGQVATVPETRGRGVMSALLKAVCADLDGGEFDLAWLGGDRQRYGRYGWACGGRTLRFDFFERYLPEPPAESLVRPLDWATDFERFRDHVAALPNALAMSDEELRMLATGQPLTGWAMGQSFIVTGHGGGTVHFGDGNPDEIVLLLAHLLREERRKEVDRWQVSVHCGAAPSALLQVCLSNYWRASEGMVWMFRVCSLMPLLEKLCRARAAQVGCGTGELGLGNLDTGESATLVCRSGRLSVREGAGEGAYALSTRDLSEVLFGICPPDLLLPGLPPDSPFRRLLPLKVHLSQTFAV